jgi:hypothetical protein
MRFEADLDRTAEQLKNDCGYDDDAPSANPFGPDASTGGDAGGNHFADNTRYLKNAPGAGNRHKAARYLAVAPTTEAAINRMVDDTLEVLESEGEIANDMFRAAYRNFLTSTYVEKHGWKSEEVETAAAEAFAEQLDADCEVVDADDPDLAAEEESDSIDRVIESEHGYLTVQVKTNTSASVKKKNRDKVDYRLGVEAEVDSRKIEVEAERV